MNDNNTDTAASAALAAAPAKPKKVQHTITLNERDKDWLKDLQGEFHGPQASDPEKPRFLSTDEAFSVLRTVAESNNAAVSSFFMCLCLSFEYSLRQSTHPCQGLWFHRWIPYRQQFRNIKTRAGLIRVFAVPMKG